MTRIGKDAKMIFFEHVERWFKGEAPRDGPQWMTSRAVFGSKLKH
jgi:hypothetical protein